jgi:methyl-accepting chemotaxis protein
LQEISRSGSQIMAAIDQIRKGSEVQAAAAEESSAAITQIEKGVELAQQRATASGEKVTGHQEPAWLSTRLPSIR